MPTIREVYSTFNDLISRQRRAVSAIDVEISLLHQDMTAADTQLAGQVDRLITDFKPETLEALDAAAKEAGRDRSFTRLISVIDQENRQKTTRISDIQAEYRPFSEIDEVIVNLQEVRHRTQNEDDVLSSGIRDLVQKAHDIERHNKTHPDFQITPENFEDLKKGNVLRSIFSGSFRSARAAVLGYTGDFSQDQDALKQNLTDRDTNRQNILNLDSQIEAARFARKKVFELKDGIKEPAYILADVRATAHDLMRNEAFVNAFAETLPEDQAVPLLEASLKVRNLAKIESNLSQQRDAAAKFVRQLSNPMDNLRKGDLKAPLKQINVDLKAAEKAVNGSVARAGYHTISASNARQAIGTYQYNSDAGNMFTMQNLLLYYMIIGSDIDPAYAQQTIGLDESAAKDLGIENIDDLQPDFAGVLSTENLGHLSTDLSSAFGKALDNIGGLDGLDTLSRGLGSLDIGSNSSFDIPTTGFDGGGSSYHHSSPSPDYGGGGGGGGGGGFD